MDLINQINNQQNTSSVGHLVPMYSRPDALETSYVGVATPEGLFACNIDRNSAVADRAKSECYNEPVEVTITLDEIMLDGEVIGSILRYDGSSYDPASDNPGNIELVHQMARSGELVLTSTNANRNGLSFRAHGQTFVNTMFKSAQRPDAKERISRLLQFLDAIYGDAIEVDLETLSFNAVGSGLQAAKVAFLSRQIEKTFQRRSSAAAQSDDTGEQTGEDAPAENADGETSEEDASEENEKVPAGSGAEGETPDKPLFGPSQPSN